MNMLFKKKLKGFVSSSNLKRSKPFYEDKLKLKLLSESDFALEFDSDGTRLRITAVKQFTPTLYTVLGWTVDDISAAVKIMKNRGIDFEKYDYLEQDDLGIWTSPSGTKVAWFRDPDGNVLSLSQ